MSTAQIQDQAQEQVTVGNEVLSIKSVYLWINSMPSFTVTNEDRERLRRGKTAHISLKIQRIPTGSQAIASSATEGPVIHALHVIRTNPTSTSAAAATEDDDSFTWRAPADFVNPSEDAIGQGVHSGEALLKSVVGPETIEVSGWNGPRFGKDAEYVVVAELAQGVFLKSKPEKIQSVC